MSEMTVNDTAPAPVGLKEPKKVIRKIRPTTVVVVGMGFTIAWVIALGYSLVKIIGAVF